MTDRSLARALFARWRADVVVALGEAREELDAINVFPVPDNDTGTNVYVTVEAAASAARAAEVDGRSLREVARAFVDGALRGARGNSGVIVSQLLRPAVAMLLETAAGDDVADDPVLAGVLLAEVLRVAADAAYAAVGSPVEGTILSVARAAADGAGAVAGSAALPEVLRAATTAAHTALARTPDQLERLRRAGVVDAGGQALTVLLDSTERVLTGRVDRRRADRRPLPVPIPPSPDDMSPGPAYEVMYLLDADDDAVPDLRRVLTPLGDSLVVVGGDGLWNVHVHVDDPGAAIEAGIAAGRPHRVVVTHLAGQAHGNGSQATGRTVVTTAAGRGLAQLFAAAGAVVLDTSDGHHADTHELLNAVATRGGGESAGEVVLLPNDRAAVAAAEAAARQLRERGVRVAVIPTRAQVQGLAALAVHDPGRSFDDDVVHMTAAAGHTRDGAVTVATRQAITSAGPCAPGDVLGVVDGDIAVVGDELAAVAEAVTIRLLGGSGELLTIVSGADTPDDLGARLELWVCRLRPDLDVALHVGGQVRYPLLIAVE